jgi:hypothetical protein
MQDAKCRMQNAGCKMQDAKCRIQDAGFKMQKQKQNQAADFLYCFLPKNHVK